MHLLIQTKCTFFSEKKKCICVFLNTLKGSLKRLWLKLYSLAPITGHDLRILFPSSCFSHSFVLSKGNFCFLFNPMQVSDLPYKTMARTSCDFTPWNLSSFKILPINYTTATNISLNQPNVLQPVSPITAWGLQMSWRRALRNFQQNIYNMPWTIAHWYLFIFLAQFPLALFQLPPFHFSHLTS